MISVTREIDKELYNKIAQGNDNEYYYLSDTQKEDILGPSLVYGYGVYGARVFKKADTYYLHYSRGESCD